MFKSIPTIMVSYTTAHGALHTQFHSNHTLPSRLTLSHIPGLRLTHSSPKHEPIDFLLAH